MSLKQARDETTELTEADWEQLKKDVTTVKARRGIVPHPEFDRELWRKALEKFKENGNKPLPRNEVFRFPLGLATDGRIGSQLKNQKSGFAIRSEGNSPGGVPTREIWIVKKTPPP